MEQQLNPKFQCKSKEMELETRYANDPKGPKKIAHIMAMHQELSCCNSYKDHPVHTVDRFTFNSCLCNYEHLLMNYYLIVTDNYDRAVMPHVGSLSDQSARMLDIIYLIRSIRLEHQEKLRKQQESKSNR